MELHREYQVRDVFTNPSLIFQIIVGSPQQ